MIEDVGAKFYGPEVTVSVNDDEKVEIRDENLSLEEVIRKQATGPA